MDLRRLLNIVFAFLTREMRPEQLTAWVAEVLREKFDHEMTRDELRRATVRRKERELGIVGGDRALMDAFSMPTGGTR
jgi:hypothetical protein